MPLTGIGAAEHPHTEVRAGGKTKPLLRRQGRRACRPWRDHEDFELPRPRHPWRGARRDEDTLSVFVCFRLAL